MALERLESSVMEAIKKISPVFFIIERGAWMSKNKES